MIYNPLERRRAEEFAAQLEPGDHTHPHWRDDDRDASDASALGELVGVTDQLNELGTQMAVGSRPSAHWQDATRRRLMAVAADEGIGATARHRASAVVPDARRAPVLDEYFPRRPRGGRRVAIVAALLTGTVAVSGVSAASGDALPGETLYNVKRSGERAQLALAGNDLGRAQLHLEFARTRIQEAGAVGGGDAAATALTDAADELRTGSALLGGLAVDGDDETPLDYLDLFTNEHRHVLETMVAEFDGDAAAAGTELLALVEDAAVRSVDLRGALACTDSGGATDELGPVPGSCGSQRDTVEGTDPEPDRGPDDAGVDAAAGSAGPGESSDAPETESDPSTGGGDTNEPVGDTPAPATDGQTDPAAGQTPADETERGVLDELSGIVEDLIG